MFLAALEIVEQVCLNDISGEQCPCETISSQTWRFVISGANTKWSNGGLVIQEWTIGIHFLRSIMTARFTFTSTGQRTSMKRSLLMHKERRLPRSYAIQYAKSAFSSPIEFGFERPRSNFGTKNLTFLEFLAVDIRWGGGEGRVDLIQNGARIGNCKIRLSPVPGQNDSQRNYYRLIDSNNQ